MFSSDAGRIGVKFCHQYNKESAGIEGSMKDGRFIITINHNHRALHELNRAESLEQMDRLHSCSIKYFKDTKYIPPDSLIEKVAFEEGLKSAIKMDKDIFEIIYREGDFKDADASAIQKVMTLWGFFKMDRDVVDGYISLDGSYHPSSSCKSSRIWVSTQDDNHQPSGYGSKRKAADATSSSRINNPTKKLHMELPSSPPASNEAPTFSMPPSRPTNLFYPPQPISASHFEDLNRAILRRVEASSDRAWEDNYKPLPELTETTVPNRAALQEASFPTGPRKPSEQGPIADSKLSSRRSLRQTPSMYRDQNVLAERGISRTALQDTLSPRGQSEPTREARPYSKPSSRRPLQSISPNQATPTRNYQCIQTPPRVNLPSFSVIDAIAKEAEKNFN